MKFQLKNQIYLSIIFLILSLICMQPSYAQVSWKLKMQRQIIDEIDSFYNKKKQQGYFKVQSDINVNVVDITVDDVEKLGMMYATTSNQLQCQLSLAYDHEGNIVNLSGSGEAARYNSPNTPEQKKMFRLFAFAHEQGHCESQHFLHPINLEYFKLQNLMTKEEVEGLEYILKGQVDTGYDSHEFPTYADFYKENIADGMGLLVLASEFGLDNPHFQQFTKNLYSQRLDSFKTSSSINSHFSHPVIYKLANNNFKHLRTVLNQPTAKAQVEQLNRYVNIALIEFLKEQPKILAKVTSADTFSNANVAYIFNIIEYNSVVEFMNNPDKYNLSKRDLSLLEKKYKSLRKNESYWFSKEKGFSHELVLAFMGSLNAQEKSFIDTFTFVEDPKKLDKLGALFDKFIAKIQSNPQNNTFQQSRALYGIKNGIPLLEKMQAALSR